MYVVNAIKDVFSPDRARTSIWLAFGGFLLALFFFDMHPKMTGGLLDSFLRTADDIFEYFAYAIAFFVLFWVVLDRFISGRKLSRHRWPKREQVISEAIFSLTSQFIFLSVSLWFAYLIIPGSMLASSYSDIGEFGLPYYAFTLFLVFFVHDTVFYWFHRLMHWEPLYKWIHKTHHESRDPTPFTTFHFHPVESVLEAIAGNCILFVLVLMPWHESVPAVWATGMILFNSIGHLGFEVYPSWWHKVPVLSNKTTAMHHYMHHQRVRGNYALYFRFWDKVCGTEFKDYEARYDAMFAKIKAKDGEAPTPSGAPSTSS
ncbi:MAG: sterol desaturase family protein [Pseudomonadota bacterium]